MPKSRANYSFYEFFAGGGMARAGLGDNWRCRFANDIDPKKARAYAENWGDDVLRLADVNDIETSSLPGIPDLVWGSFPCQDLSLAGDGAGLKGERSGAFWPFWRLVEKLGAGGRPPSLVVLENVCGALTSHGGRDFRTIAAAIDDAGYDFGALVIDAARFVPQSRPRLFIIAARKGMQLPKGVVADGPKELFATKALLRAYDGLTSRLKKSWIWWDLPEPATARVSLSALLEEAPNDVSWKSPDETRRLLDMMSDVNRKKVAQAKKSGRRMVGTLYRRTRIDDDGNKVQRAEVRFDDLSGCLRTPAGGSSRQLLLIVEGQRVRARLVSARETARLMGLPDSYLLPENYNEAYHLTGDGVAVPVVRHLASHIFEPVLDANRSVKANRAA